MTDLNLGWVCVLIAVVNFGALVYHARWSWKRRRRRALYALRASRAEVA